jgi:excisionase family DNA binding protein
MAALRNDSTGRPRGRLLTVPEVARLLRQDESTVYRKIGRRELPALQLGGRGAGIRIDSAELDAWLRAPKGGS